MKVILLEDVKSLGKKGEVVEVSDGYARNALLPKKKGIEATAKNMNDLKLQKANSDKIAKEQYEAALELKKQIEAGKVVLKIKAGEGGRLFGAISAKEVGTAVEEQLGLEIDKKKVVLKEPIKSLGTFNVQIKLHKDVQAELSVHVEEQ